MTNPLKFPFAIIATFLLSFSFNAFAQSDESKLDKIDSLKAVIQAAKNDTDKINAWIAWDNLLPSFQSNQQVELRIELNEKVDRLCAKNLKKQLNQKDNLFFQKAMARANLFLGLMHHRSGKITLSKGQLLKALKSYENTKDFGKIASCLNTLGIVEIGLGDFESALVYLRKASHLNQKLDRESNLASNYINIGNVYKHKGQYQKAIHFFTKSQRIHERLKDTLRLGQSLSHTAGLYGLLGDRKQAIKLYLRVFELYERIKYNIGTAVSLHNLANNYYIQKRYKLANDYQQQSLKLFEEHEYKLGIAQSLNLKSNLLLIENNHEEALRMVFRSLEIMKSIHNREGIAVSTTNLASIQFDLKMYNPALKNATEGHRIAKEIGELSTIRDAAETLFRIYKAQGDFGKALQFYEEYKTLSDSINNQEAHRELVRQEYKYKYDQKNHTDSLLAAEAMKVKNAEIALQQAENLKSRREKTFLIGILCLAVLLVVFINLRLKQNKRQNKIIESQKQEVDKAYDELEDKNKEIKHSITYAQRIQNAILPQTEFIQNYLMDSFILFKPQNIVSGDFYWMHTYSKKSILFAVADCTGHGVPGAMVSIVCNSALNRAVKEFKLRKPGSILNKTRELVVAEFSKSDELVRDGMDIALCSLIGTTLYYSGANHPLWIVRAGSNQIEEYAAQRQGLGKVEEAIPFETTKINLNIGDTLYLFSDGFADQFGGEKGKKFMRSRFKKLLLSIQSKTIRRQRQLINQAFDSWKGDLEQIDDVCVMGVRI